MPKLPKGFVNIVPVEEPTLNMLLCAAQHITSTVHNAQRSRIWQNMLQYITSLLQVVLMQVDVQDSLSTKLDMQEVWKCQVASTQISQTSGNLMGFDNHNY